MLKAKKLRKIEGHGLMEVSRKDYIISSENGTLKRFLKNDKNYVVEIFDAKTGVPSYYLKSSPVVTKLTYGLSDWCLTQDAVYCHDVKGYVQKGYDKIVTIDNKNYLNASVCCIGGVYYLKTDKRVVYDKFSSRYILSDQAVPLHPSLYGKNCWTTHPNFNDRELREIDGYYVRMIDTFEELDKNNNSTIAIKHLPGRYYDAFISLHNPILGFQRKNINNGKIKEDLADGKTFKLIGELDMFVHYSIYDRVYKEYKEWYAIENSKVVKKAIEKANSCFSDVDSNENVPKEMCFDRTLKPRWGGNIGYDGRTGFPFSLSRTFKETGGIKYTFGVEIETSNGFISNEKLDSVGLCSMGDNSISGNEYITGILHGDYGVDLLKKQMDLIHNECVVDDTCSIHVHIGGKNRRPALKETSIQKERKDSEWKNMCWSPDFNINFGINAIKLGCMIEEDLFKTQPVSRDPYKKHCKSITTNIGAYSGDFRGINKNNYKELLGKYVFGRPIDRVINKMYAPDRWNNQRYKWLNLVNAMSATPIDTIEFRIFSPTTVYWKVLQAVRISMAFTWFVENRQNLIQKGGVSLKTVLYEAFKNSPYVLKDVSEYIESRTKKFNRTNIYYNEERIY